jgi:hypothetical protein
MTEAPRLALSALAELERGADRLDPSRRDAFRRQLRAIGQALRNGPTYGARPAAPPRIDDPYARLIPRGRALDIGPGLGPNGPLQMPGSEPQPAPQPPANAQQPAPAAPPPPPKPDATSTIGQRAASALEAVGFSDFVAGLVRGTFQAIVDATAQQMREYAELVSSLSRSAEDFTRDNVTADQTRLWLANRYAADLYVAVPPPGKPGGPQLRVQQARVGESPDWLSGFGLGGQELSDELAEGSLLAAGQGKLGEERLQNLATMVLMGINRVVVKDGNIAAKLQFHAEARDKTAAQLAVENRNQTGSIAQRQSDLNAGAVTMVSTVKANAQADASVRADLMGEVRIRFATETFNLNNFADGPAIQLISQHARWRGDAPAPAASTPAAPAPAVTQEGA